MSGIVGASYSSNSKIAAHAATMYEIPMISYQSSTTAIGDTDYFPFLFRSDNYRNYIAVIIVVNMILSIAISFIFLYRSYCE